MTDALLGVRNFSEKLIANGLANSTDQTWLLEGQSLVSLHGHAVSGQGEGIEVAGAGGGE